MKYRVILEVGYNTAWFEFEDITDAGEFAKTLLMHQVSNEDTKHKSKIRLEIIDATIEKNEEEDD